MALILDYNYNTNTHIMGVFLIFKKQISNIITAYKKVANANNRLLIVGDGPELSKLRKLTLELELKENIEDYIKWYNEERINVKRNGLSPLEYRQQSVSQL